MEYAGFWKRTYALVVDLLVGAPLIVLSTVLYRVSLLGAIASVFLGALVFVYNIYFHARWGQTLGKMAAKIKVVQLDGTAITRRQAVLRNSVDVTLWVANAIPTIWFLATWDGPSWSTLSWLAQVEAVRDRNPLSVPYSIVSQAWVWSEIVVLLFNKKRRALHDFIAGTVVVTVAPELRTYGIGVPLPDAETR